MKKVFYYLFIGLFIYCTYIFYMTNAYKFYNEKSGLIKHGEWSWYGDVGTRIECNNKKCTLILFSTKDGLALKQFLIDDNCSYED